MASCFYVVEELQMTRGKGIIADTKDQDERDLIDIFLSKLEGFGVYSKMAENVCETWLNSVEIEVETFSNFFQNHIENGTDKDTFSEKELEAIFEIKKVIDSKAEYVSRYGYVFLAHL